MDGLKPVPTRFAFFIALAYSLVRTGFSPSVASNLNLISTEDDMMPC
jgi:hypothetical protein